MNTIKSEISITLAEVIVRTILPYAQLTNATLSRYLLDAQSFNPKVYNLIVSNSRKITATGSITAAVAKAKELFA